MARLTLEEGGQTRRFKLSSGKLTFGSGEKATLKLASGDVAELHGQIEMGPDGAVLHTAKGVMPAKVAGKALSGPHTLKAGQAVLIGSAKLSIEYDEGEGPASATPRRPSAGSSRAGSSRAGSSRGRSGSGARGRSRGGSRDDASEGAGSAQRRPRPKSSGVPSWAVAAVVIVGAIAVTYGLFSMASDDFDFEVRYGRYQREKADDLILARGTLNDIAQQELTPEQRRVVDKELATYVKTIAVIDDTMRNQSATKWFTVRLQKYYKSKWNPAGSRAHARLFVKRARWFMKEYPTYPEIDWVRRVLERVEPVAELGTPMELEDLRVDVWGSTAAEPKFFGEAFKAIDDYAAAHPTGIEKAGVDQLRAETLEAEREFYDEKLGDAAVVYDMAKYPTKYAPDDAIEDMIRIIVGCHTMSLREDATNRLLAITEFSPAILASYKRSQPSRFESLVEMSEIRAFAEKNGLL